MFILIPKPLRDRLYDWIAKHRYEWFGKRDSCLMPTPDVRMRFLDESMF
ncbi:DCC1-like thiol-disulfide oxidoreductase family protein [Thermolongibacillus altinsuensis]